MKGCYKKSYLWLINLFAFISVIVINFVAQYLRINNFTPGEVSKFHPGILTPPGFTFMIWSVIYSLLGIFIFSRIVYQDDTDTERVGILFFISSLLNISWIFSWHYEQVLLSLFIMFALFATLFYIYMVTRESKNVFTRISFSAYYSWITIALLASLFVTFGYNTYGAIEQTIAIIGILFIGVLALVHLYNLDDLTYSFTVLWALGGLMYKYISSNIPRKVLIAATAIVTLTVAFAIINKLSERKIQNEMKGSEMHA